MLVFREAKYTAVLGYQKKDFEAVIENLRSGESIGISWVVQAALVPATPFALRVCGMKPLLTYSNCRRAAAVTNDHASNKTRGSR